MEAEAGSPRGVTLNGHHLNLRDMWEFRCKKTFSCIQGFAVLVLWDSFVRDVSLLSLQLNEI